MVQGQDVRNRLFANIDIAYAMDVMQHLSEIVDNPLVGNRSAASDAEYRAATYLEDQFRKVGLQNVTRDENMVDRWSFNKATITYTADSGEEITAPLGGYATSSHFDKETLELLYVGRGTEADYQGVDATGRIVLVDIDQMNEWWINFPAYEAYLHGAAALICVNVGGFGQDDDDTLVSEDICGPNVIPVFSIGKNDAGRLKQTCSRDGVATIVLDTDSVVEPNHPSYNIWGEIPGEIDETIIIINHYDAYYRTVFDDVQGIGWEIGIAKAFIDAGIQPRRTIRFVAHGSEEWGLIDNKYDWAIGAYRQINRLRTEWQSKGFATVNLDGFYACLGETRFCIPCTKELYDFVEQHTAEYRMIGRYTIEANLALTSSTEDFSYARAGIPGFVAGAYDGCIADRRVLHSTLSTFEAGFDEEAFRLFHELFIDLILDLDQCIIRPMNFDIRLGEILETMPESDGEGARTVRQLVETGQRVSRLIEAINKNPAASELGYSHEVLDANRDLHYAFKSLIAEFVRLDWNDQMIIPHTRYIANLDALKKAQSLVAQDAVGAADVLSGVDFNYYSSYFSRKSYDYFVRQVVENCADTWGTGLVENGNEDLFDAIRGLRGMTDYPQSLISRDINEAIEHQEAFLQDSICRETVSAQICDGYLRKAEYSLLRVLDML